MTRFGSLITLASLLFVGSAHAGAADTAAQAKIDEAINVHYLDTNFAKAEKTLKAAISACAESCSAPVVGRAWMYIGIIRAVGNQDTAGASDAFAKAFEADANAKLDVDLATPEVKKLFEAAKGSAGSGDATETETETTETPAATPASSAGSMECTPAVAEVETRRPIPVACTADEGVKRAVLHYKAAGSTKWEQITLGMTDGQWMGTIPCSATSSSGTLKWYLTGAGSAGEQLDNFGSKDEPTEITLVESSAEAPPAYPDKEPPNRCMDVADCPEEMRGTPACPGTQKAGAGGGGAWGASCKAQSECGADMACINGTCETPSACETDAECNGGVCQNAICSYADGGGGSSAASKNLLGIHFGLDLAQVSGKSICDTSVNRDFKCYLNDGGNLIDYQLGNGVNRSGAELPSALTPATMRVMLSFEHLFTDNIGAEARAGVAFNAQPSSGIGDLLHLEARAKYWFTGTGGNGLHPYIHLGGGLGQVDVAVQAKVLEDSQSNPLGTGYAPDANMQSFCNASVEPTCKLDVVAYRRLGKAFVGAGLGAMLNLGAVGINAAIDAKVMLPASGLVLTPNLGLQFGL